MLCACTAHPVPDTFEEATYRILKWRLIPFLMLCYVIAYLDRVNVGFAKLQMLGDLYLIAGCTLVSAILTFGFPARVVKHAKQ